MRTRTLPVLRLLSVAVGTAVLLGACGSTQPSTEDETSSVSDVRPITLTDAIDRTVELDGPAEHVVVLEWQQVEDVLTLGVEPVGVADVEGYNTWNTAEKLDPNTTDVGTRTEPNMDAVFSTNPDLVIAEAERGSPLLEQLENYDVPVLVTQGADAADPIANMKDTLNLIAQALGKEDEAAQAIEDFDAHVADAKEAIAAASPEATEFAFADAWIDGSNVAVRPFGQGSLIGELGEAIGLTNVWTGEVDAAYGLGQTDVEGITSVEGAHFFYSSTESDDWMNALKKNSMWTNAGFVTADRAHPFPEGVWMFGGPKSCQQVIDAFVDVLT